MIWYVLKARWVEFLLAGLLVYRGDWPFGLIVLWLGHHIFWIHLNADYRRASRRVVAISHDGMLGAICEKLGVTEEDRRAMVERQMSNAGDERKEAAERDMRLAVLGPVEWLMGGAK